MSEEEIKQMIALIFRLAFTPKADGTWRTAEEIDAITGQFMAAKPEDPPAPIQVG